MSKKKKVLVGISIGLNVLLLALVGWGLLKMNFVKEQVLITEVQSNLVELEGLIAHESETNWSEPKLVTTKLGDVLNGITLGITTGHQLGTLSKRDDDILQKLYLRLNQYPTNDEYSFVDLNGQDKKNFEELREILREAELGFNITIHHDKEIFIKQAEVLQEKIQYPLDY